MAHHDIDYSLLGRRKRVVCTPQVMRAILDALSKGETFSLTGWPPGATLAEFRKPEHHSGHDPSSIYLIVLHPDFPKVVPGDPVPELVLKFHKQEGKAIGVGG